METPSWCRLAAALKVVLKGCHLDWDKVGKSQRLDYDDFEAIFYHLFLMINPGEAKKRFRSLGPGSARDTGERNRFFELCARFINDEQITTHKVVTSQLRILGGEPFRRIVEALIKTACVKRMGDDVAQKSGPALVRELREEMAGDREAMEKLRRSMARLKQLRQQVKESNLEVKALTSGHQSSSMDIASSSSTTTTSYDSTQIVRSLLARLEVVLGETKVATERINSIKLPREPTEAVESATKKRLSQFIRETVSKLNTTQELQVSETQLNEQYRSMLVKYDEGVDNLLKAWHQEEERRDEAMLNDPEIRAHYDQLTTLIPMIDLPPIRIPGDPASSAGPQATGYSLSKSSLETIEELLKLYPDDRYDDQEILKHSKKFFS